MCTREMSEDSYFKLTALGQRNRQSAAKKQDGTCVCSPRKHMTKGTKYMNH